MKVLVCGSRYWPAFDDDVIRNRLDELPEGTVVIHGGAPGADYWGGFHAKMRGLRILVFKADWARYGKKAGPLRNRQMLDEQPDLVIAFKMPRSRGTQDTIDEARRRGIPVEEHALRTAPISERREPNE